MTMPSKLTLLLCATLFLTLSSCQNPFHPPLIDNSNSQIQNRNPREVLQNLERSYLERNINIFKTLLSDDFRFELISSEVGQIGIDVNEDGINDSWWGYDEEVQFTQNLFSTGSSDGNTPSPDDLQLRLQIPPDEAWENDPELGHENWIVVPCIFDLKLFYISSNSMLTASGVARFYLKPLNDRWYIAIWRDESNL